MPKISKIQTIPFRLPLVNLDKPNQQDAVEHILVRLVTDTGHIGLAEAIPRLSIYGETPESIQTIIQKHLAPRLIGLPIEDVPAINQQMTAIANNLTAKGALDIALHEAIVATKGLSPLDFGSLITELPNLEGVGTRRRPYLTSAKTKLKVSYLLTSANFTTMLAEAKAAYDKEVRLFKMTIGTDFDAEVDCLKKLQAEFAGSGVSWYADADEKLLIDQLQMQLRQLAELGVLYVEEPLPIEMIPARIFVITTNILPIIANDSTLTYRDLIRELSFDTFDILNIEPSRTGYYQSGQMLTLARRHEKGVMVSSIASSTLGAMQAAIFAAQAGIDYPLEVGFMLRLQEDIVNQPIKIVNGYIELDSLRGITVDKQQLKKFVCK